MSIHYMEIVSNDVDGVCGTYERVHGLTFDRNGDPALGNARVAVRSDGSLVGVRAPMADHESPIIRTYLEVADIEAAAAAAADSGAMIAYPPTRQGDRGTFAIYIQDGMQHGLWQR